MNSSLISSNQLLPISSACFFVPYKNSQAAISLKYHVIKLINVAPEVSFIEYSCRKKKPNLSSYVAKASPPMVTMNTPITFASPRGGAIPCFLAAAHFPKDVENRVT